MKTAPDHCSFCGADARHYQAVQSTTLNFSDSPVRWTDVAAARLLEIPEGFIRDMTRWRIEINARKNGISVIDPAVMEARYQEWSNVSHRSEKTLLWEDEAAARLSRIPSFAQGIVIKEIEAYVKEIGADCVTNQVMDRMTERWAKLIHQQGY